ncbi:hypothetical protein HII31_13241 [Pseudocercospora fuligena]|uniref:Uncharacterized protein n=1 Tax=Pseudocercospora fuligena TaxID=685502 RepID=A0A8H6R590_9PEZI|nr:hypothetical protein HII31_13241 [Pseudocercospora fuligena]
MVYIRARIRPENPHALGKAIPHCYTIWHDFMIDALHTPADALSGAMISRHVTNQATHIGTSATHQFAATIFGLIDDAPEHWARLVALLQEAPQMSATQEILVTSPCLKARSSTASSAHDSGYGPPPENNPGLGPSPRLDVAQDLSTTQLLHGDDLDVFSDKDARASLLSMSINERGYSGVGERPKTAPGRISELSTSPMLNTRATLRSRIKYGSTRISACISDFCRPATGYQHVSSSTSSLSLRDMLDTFPMPPPPDVPQHGTSLTATEKVPEAQEADQPRLTEPKLSKRLSTRSSIKGIFKNIKHRLSTREALEPARQSTHRGSVMERGSIIVTPYDVVEWRQNGRSVRYLVSPRLMREGMLLASQTSLT